MKLPLMLSEELVEEVRTYLSTIQRLRTEADAAHSRMVTRLCQGTGLAAEQMGCLNTTYLSRYGLVFVDAPEREDLFSMPAIGGVQ